MESRVTVLWTPQARFRGVFRSIMSNNGKRRAKLGIRNRVNKLMEAHVGKYSKIINIRLSSFRLLMTKNWRNFFIKNFNCNLSLGLHKGRPSYRRSLPPSKENIQHFKKLNLLTFLFLCVMFSFLEPDPDSESRSGSRDPIESGSTTEYKVKNDKKTLTSSSESLWQNFLLLSHSSLRLRLNIEKAGSPVTLEDKDDIVKLLCCRKWKQLL